MANWSANNSNSLFEFKRFSNHRSVDGGSHGASPIIEFTSQRDYDYEPI